MPPIFFFLAHLFASGLFGIVVCVVYACVGVVTVRIIEGGKTMLEAVIEEQASRGKPVIVRPDWALAAVCLDAVQIVLTNAALWYFLQHPGSALPSSHAALLEEAIAVRLAFGFIGYVHYKATRPGKPKRVLVAAENGA